MSPVLICEKRMHIAILRTGVLAACILSAGLGLYSQVTPSKETHEIEGIPPRVSPSDYLSHGQAGAVSIGAEFLGHFVPTPQGTFTTEDYVAVETGLFGPSDARLKLSRDDFSLRINGKKALLPTQSYVSVFSSLKDPNWAPPEPAEKSKTTSIGSGGGQDSTPPPVVHMPLELQRAMEQHVQKSALAEGDRALPQAGLIFFEYRGKPKNIKSVELVYNGAAGQTTVALQP